MKSAHLLYLGPCICLTSTMCGWAGLAPNGHSARSVPSMPDACSGLPCLKGTADWRRCSDTASNRPPAADTMRIVLHSTELLSDGCTL